MRAKVLSGEAVSREMRAEMAEEVARLREKEVRPGLGVVLVGDNPASISYIKGKRRACERIGIHTVEHNLSAGAREEEVVEVVSALNAEKTINGILVQVPLPGQLDEGTILTAVDPSKDVDGLHPVNLGRLLRGEEGFLPCTPHGIQQMLLRSRIEIDGAHVVIVGRSTLVGRPLANILLRKSPGANATVTVCHTGTRDVAKLTRQADIIVVAAGRPNTLTPDMVAEGSVVVDVGVNRVSDPSRKRGYRLIGDVDFEGVSRKAGAITPVPGGVGPMTITMLLRNTISSARRAHGLPASF